MPDDDIDDMPDVPLNLDGHVDAEVVTAEEPSKDDTKEESTDKPTDDKSENKEAKPEGEQEPAKPEGEAKPEPDEAERQRQLNAEMAARRVQERSRARQEVAERLDQTYGPKTQQQLEEEGLDPIQAQIQAMQEKLTYSEQRGQIAELNAGLQAEAVNVEYDFPIYREKNPDGSKNPEYDPDFTAKVQAGYQRRAGIQVDDETGLVLHASESMYDYYKEMAEYRQAGTKVGASQGQAEMQAMMARTEDATGGSSSSSKRGESLEEMGERLADVPIY